MPVPNGPEAGACRPRRPGLLCNPRSGRLARRSSVLREVAKGFPGGLYREACDPAAIGQACRELVGEGADIIIVLGGDGTLQAVLDQVLLAAGATSPPLAVVPCGSTNMTAIDLGCGRAPGRILGDLRQRLLRDENIPLAARPVLRVHPGSRPPLYGMFFGMGIIATGVRYFRERVRGRGLTGETASAIALLRMLFRLVGGRSAPLQVRYSEDQGPVIDGSLLLLFASTLDRLLLGMRPYWGREQAPMHVTAIRDRPRQLWRSLPPLARGRGDRLDEHDFRSRNLHTLELEFDGDFVLDGEIHAGQPGQSLRIDTAGPVRFAIP